MGPNKVKKTGFFTFGLKPIWTRQWIIDGMKYMEKNPGSLDGLIDELATTAQEPEDELTRNHMKRGIVCYRNSKIYPRARNMKRDLLNWNLRFSLPPSSRSESSPDLECSDSQSGYECPALRAIPQR